MRGRDPSRVNWVVDRGKLASAQQELVRRTGSDVAAGDISAIVFAFANVRLAPGESMTEKLCPLWQGQPRRT